MTSMAIYLLASVIIGALFTALLAKSAKYRWLDKSYNDLLKEYSIMEGKYNRAKEENKCK